MAGSDLGRVEALVRPWRIWRWSERLAESGSIFTWRCSLILIMSVGCLPIYLTVNAIGPSLGNSFFNPYSQLDSIFPTIPWTILIYLSLFWLFYPLTFFICPNHQRGRLQIYSVVQGLILLQLISNLIFILFPTGVHLRQEMVDALANTDSFSRSLIGLMHSIDSSHSAWPSLHISNTVLMCLALHRWIPEVRPDQAMLLRWMLWISCAAMAVSTLTTKQHYLFDVATGGALAALLWNRLLSPWWDSLDALPDADLPTV
jgi:membrane-associated phospholipid phosphatase